MIDESKYEEILGLYFPTGRTLLYESEKEIIDLCTKNDNVDIWLDDIAKKPYIISGYSKVCNAIN